MDKGILSFMLVNWEGPSIPVSMLNVLDKKRKWEEKRILFPYMVHMGLSFGQICNAHNTHYV